MQTRDTMLVLAIVQNGFAASVIKKLEAMCTE